MRATASPAPCLGETIEIEVDDGCRVERQHLADQEAADDGNPQRLPQLTALAEAEAERQCAEHGGGPRHAYGAQPDHGRVESTHAALPPSLPPPPPPALH